MAYVRHLSQLRGYGISSRSATNINSSKDTISSMKTTENIITFLWKTVACASTMLKPLTTVAFRKTYNSAKEVVSKKIKENTAVKSLTVTAPTPDSSSHTEVTKTTSSTAEEAIGEKVSDPEASLYDWFRGRNGLDKKPLVTDGKKSKKPVICKSSLEKRSRFLVESLKCATSPESQFIRLEEICKHLLVYPQEKRVMQKVGLLRLLLWLKKTSTDELVLSQAAVSLSLLGFHNPPKGNGIRILSIDGGGMRGLMAIEIMRQLEENTNKRIYELFDYICGVSSGAILALLLGGLRLSLDECETLYKKLSLEVFNQSPLWGTGMLMWNHAYYDTSRWVDMLKKMFGEALLVDMAKHDSSPKLAAISAVMNLPTLQAFVFRNYAFPPLSRSQYLGSCNNKIWEAVRASGAAPGYFEEFRLDEYLHQDGGIMLNNPAALAVHESRLLWPFEPLQCLVSIGNGRYFPGDPTEFTSTSIRTKVLKLIDSATDTEGVHIALNDLLPSKTYFRMNPYLTEFLYLDENRPEKLEQLKDDAKMYVRRNEYKISQASNNLIQPRNLQKRVQDWYQTQKLLLI